MTEIVGLYERPKSQNAVVHLKPKVDPAAITWRNLRRDEFWRSIPAWRDIDAATFLDHRWQEKNAVINTEQLIALIGELAPAGFSEDLRAGAARAPMAVRLSPYVLALIDWSRPVEDPLRRQFLPLASQLEEDHPLVGLDTLAEQEDAPVPGLTHRYFDKALFLTTDLCPVYCRYCTRSYAVGGDTLEVQKVALGAPSDRWAAALQYISERVELEDIVVSGGDVYRLKAANILLLGNRLLDIPHVRRIRFATKGLAIQPMKVLSDREWIDALSAIAERGRHLHKDVAIHTHFNHPNELTGITEDALGLIFERGIPVRNLSVTLCGVNDDAATLIELYRRLSWVNVRPYYQYVGDMVKGTDDLRTSLDDVMRLEKLVRGATAGHNTPTFVLDAPGGGGKRDLYSFEYYDRESGISVYTAPAVKPGRYFVYADPLRYLRPEVRAAWREPRARQRLIEGAFERARKLT
jgi:lysine 2,3-aminomutase